ncbi:helix-turn-helix domain-containing protein [Candidatus Woesearchaeota archaeon]|nr:helix-turn-helix domain-containing protein [Candidatus Woesearchaeota archaeon]
MFKFSFKIKHRNCSETALSAKFPQHHITVIDIQSKNPRQKQYFYYITGNEKQFDAIVKHLKKSKAYKLCKEIERSKDTLLLLVMLDQKSYVQNLIQKHNGFFLEHHTVYGGYEYWHIGLLDKKAITILMKEIKKIGDMKVVYIGEVDFSHTLLSEQQKRIFKYAFEQGYYKIPRRLTIEQIAKALKLNHATVGEHLQKAENKLIGSVAHKI